MEVTLNSEITPRKNNIFNNKQDLVIGLKYAVKSDTVRVLNSSLDRISHDLVHKKSVNISKKKRLKTIFIDQIATG